MRVITFDVEIAKGIEEFPDGWEAARSGRCGISSLALYDTDTERYHVYGPQVDFKTPRFVVSGLGSLDEGLHHLNSADWLVGFNSLDFDTPCLEGAVGRAVEPKQYDILTAIYRETKQRHWGWSRLNGVCERTLGLTKIGHGERAPELFQHGRFAELFEYNIHDVHLTRVLFNHIAEYGWIELPDGERLEVWKPEEILRA